ncbi:MAG: CoA transferase [Novosphingobium sp.]
MSGGGDTGYVTPVPATGEENMSVLRGVRIVELAEDVAGEYCGKLLADFGAEVIKVERPGQGSPTRTMAPLIRGSDGRSESGLFAYLNTNKQSVTIDLSSNEGVEAMRALIGSAAAVIDDHDEPWLGERGLAQGEFEARFARTVFCNVTAFGQGAPADFRIAKGLNVLQASGWGYHTSSQQDLSKPPLKGAGRFLGDYEGGIEAAICVMAALVGRERTGRGEYVELSRQGVLVSRADHIVGRMLAGDMPVGDSRGAFVPPSPAGAYPCADGYIHLYATPVHWQALVKLLGNPDWTADFDDIWLFTATEQQLTTFREKFTQWLAGKTRDQLCEEAQKLDIPIVRVNDAADLLASEQLAARGFFQPLDHPVLGRALYPTASYKLSATPVRLERPAPSLGEHNDLLGDKPAAQPKPAGAMSVPPGRPLEGVRVLAITKVWAGPYAAKLLAFMGAEVIRVESCLTPDSMRTFMTEDLDNSAIFQSMNPDVLSVAVNMKSPKGFEQLRRMIAISDIVIDNLRPGAMERMGLDYESLRGIRDDIIAVSLKMNGTVGPDSHLTGYAPSFAALGGIGTLVGYDGEPPSGMNQFYGDTTAGAAIAYATLAALMHRQRTGEGQFVDVSATEALTSMIGDSLLEYSLTGNAPRHDANRHADMAPHGVYPCQNGEWISIAVDSEQVWRNLCRELGADALASETRFASLQARQEHVSALDEEISRLTASRHAASLAALLRQAGVPATKSQNSLDLISDTLLWQRRTYTTATDSRGRHKPLVGAPWRFGGRATPMTRGAPMLGEHNAYVYCELLGLSQAELQALIDEGAVQ